MRLYELFCHPDVGPFCIGEYVFESEGFAQFCWRVLLMYALVLPMFAIVAPIWCGWTLWRMRR